MALPEYNSGYTSAPVNRQRQRRQDRRAERRAKKSINEYTPTPGSTADPYAGATSDGFQGTWTAPRNTTDHPFYDPQSNYTQQGQQYMNPAGTYLQETAKDQSPAGTYYGWAANQGYGGMDAKSQAVQGMYGEFSKGYEAARLNNNFELRFENYLNQQNVPGLLEQMTSQQMGIDNRQFSARDRWQWRG